MLTFNTHGSRSRLGGIHYQEPDVFRVKAVGHVPQWARHDKGDDEERRAVVTSIQKVRLMEARRIYAQYPERQIRDLTPFELGMKGRRLKDNPFCPDTEAEEFEEWNAGYESRLT